MGSSSDDLNDRLSREFSRRDRRNENPATEIVRVSSEPEPSAPVPVGPKSGTPAPSASDVERG